MRMLKWLAGLVLAGLMTCAPIAPAIADDVKISAMPAATLPDDAIKLAGAQGSGCATGVSPCSNVAVTTGALATYLAANSAFTGAYQPIDTDLTAIAALSTTSFGRSLLTQADAPTARTTLGLAIGTNVQAYNANLACIAGLSPAANKITLWTGSSSCSVITASTFGQSLLAAADAPSARALLGSYVVCQSAVASPVTGTTTETTLATCSIPANTMGANGQVEIVTLLTFTGSANTKTIKVKFGATTFCQLVPSSGQAIAQGYCRIANRGATNSQVGQSSSSTTFFGYAQSSGSPVTSAIDTTSSVTVTITGTLTTTSETIQFESWLVRVIGG